MTGVVIVGVRWLIVSGRDTLPLREWNETCGFVIAYSVCVKCAFRAWNATHSVALIVILLSLLFGAAKRSRRISYSQAKKRDSSLRLRFIQNDSIRHAYNICCMRKDRYHIWHNFNLFRNDCHGNQFTKSTAFQFMTACPSIHERCKRSIHSLLHIAFVRTYRAR